LREPELREIGARVSGALHRLFPVAAVFLLLIVGGETLHAAVKVLRVDPRQTDAAIEEVRGPHLAVYDPQVPSAHRLLVFLPGTRARPEGGLAIDSAFARWGYRAVSLDYENGVIAVACAHSLESSCFDHYREAIVTGAPVSQKISVNAENSILNRLEKLLLYLVKTDPAGGWDEFVEAARPAWNRILIAGHSQGSGHAAYIGKTFAVDRVLMFSGPQDYLDDLHEPAPWQSEPSATPFSRYFAFLNENDPFNVHHQIANCAALMGVEEPKTLMVEPGEEIRGSYQILINSETVGPHGSTLLPKFEEVWKYMAGADTEVSTLRPERPSQPPATPAH